MWGIQSAMMSFTVLVSLDDQLSISRLFPSSIPGTCLVAHCTTDIQISSSSILRSSFLRTLIKVSFGKVAKSFDLNTISVCVTISRLQYLKSLLKGAIERAYL